VNCNWTLQIQDVNNNTVRDASGSGTSMSFNWDGTGDGETNIPDGVYNYVISAQTNGLALQSLIGGGSSLSLSAASLSASQHKELYAVSTDGYGSPVPLALYPQGFDTNSLTIFKASPAEIDSLYSDDAEFDATAHDSIVSPDFSGPSGQSTAAPGRPPNNPVKNAAGTIGIAYEQYLPEGFAISHGPPTGWPSPLPQFVTIDSNTNLFFDRIVTAKTIGDNFSLAMKKGGWKTVFNKGNNNVSASDLKKSSLGGTSIFNNVNFGVLLGHGSFSTTAEDDNVKYTYFWLWNSQNNVSTPMRFADFDFGGSDPTTGLRWMTVIACNVLNHTDYNSMHSNFRIPINDNLHLLNGVVGLFSGMPTVGTLYATNLLNNTVSIPQAWINAGQQAYAHFSFPTAESFATVGWPACFSDTLQSFSSPDFDDDLQYQSTQVTP